MYCKICEEKEWVACPTCDPRLKEPIHYESLEQFVEYEMNKE